ncbi:MAG: peptidyl-prolyl cis-trans isomerase [Brevinema sp.]
MKNTLFAEVSGTPILGTDVVRSVKRFLTERENDPHYADIPNDENIAYINAEGLQRAIDRIALKLVAQSEGFIIDDETVSAAIFELRTQYEDDNDWEILLDDLGLEDSTLRSELHTDLMVEALFTSRVEALNAPGDEEAKEYYQHNKESMQIPDKYTFIEMEVSENAREAAAVLAEVDGAKIMSLAKERGLKCSFSENMSKIELPEALQNVLSDLPEGKIASLPADDGTVVLVKLLKKNEGRIMEAEEVLPGLKEYLTVMQHKALYDVLVEEALDKATIVYHNADLLKNLKAVK